MATAKKTKKATGPAPAEQTEVKTAASQAVDEMTSASIDAAAAGAAGMALGSQSAQAAERHMLLSRIFGSSGLDDIAQGDALLAVSQELDLMSTLVSGMSSEDLNEGMELAAISGQVTAVGDLLTYLEMPIIANFLVGRGERLRHIAVQNLLRFSATHTMAQAMQKTSEDVAELGSNEVAEGRMRLAASQQFADESEALSQASLDMTAEGLANLAASEALERASRSLREESEKGKL